MTPDAREMLNRVISPRASRRAAIAAAAALVLFSLIWLDAWLGGPRSVNREVNRLVCVASLFLPLASLILTLRCRPGWKQVLALTVLLPMVGVSLLALMLVPLADRAADSVQDEPLTNRTVQTRWSSIRAFRSSAGGFSSFDAGVEEHIPLGLGLVWVHHLDYQHSENDVRIEVIGRHRVRLTYPGHPPNHPKPVQVVVWTFG